MCWYVLERYVYSLTRTSYLTPEFQKHSLGIGMDTDTHTYTQLQSELSNQSQHDFCWVLGLKKPSIEDEEDEDDEDEDEDDDSEDEESEQPEDNVHLTPLELEGIWNLLGKLEALPTSKKCVPAGIHNAPALITHIKVVCLFVRLSVGLPACLSTPSLMAAPWCPTGTTEGTRRRHPQTVLHRATHRQVV